MIIIYSKFWSLIGKLQPIKTHWREENSIKLNINWCYFCSRPNFLKYQHNPCNFPNRMVTLEWLWYIFIFRSIGPYVYLIRLLVENVLNRFIGIFECKCWCFTQHAPVFELADIGVVLLEQQLSDTFCCKGCSTTANSARVMAAGLRSTKPHIRLCQPHTYPILHEKTPTPVGGVWDRRRLSVLRIICT